MPNQMRLKYFLSDPGIWQKVKVSAEATENIFWIIKERFTERNGGQGGEEWLERKGEQVAGFLKSNFSSLELQ